MMTSATLIKSVPLSQRVQISASTPEQWAEQTTIWQQATQNRPDDAQAWLTLARLQAAQNAHAQAEQALARVLERPAAKPRATLARRKI